MIVDVKRYLERIGISEVEEPSRDFLTSLMHNHLLAVPFENLDIHQGTKIKLYAEHLYEKIMMRGRGGFCYELNGLFAWLLQQLGFEVCLLSARVYDVENCSYGPNFDHLTLLVKLEQSYLADVGFGDCFRMPILFPNGSVKDVSGEYRLQPSQLDQGGYQVERLNGSEWDSEYCFDLTSRTLEDFEDMCSYHQNSPDSHFTRRMLCTVATQQGRKTLTPDTLIITKGKVSEKTPVPTREDFHRLLLEHFGITL